MRTEDLEQVQAIDRISFSLPWPASAYQYELHSNPMSLLWVAEAETPGGVLYRQNDRRIVGMIVVWLILDEAHIATIAVHPEHRGRGIAQGLLVTALKRAIRKGSQKATLEVRANNIAAQRLYSRFRFEVVGGRPRYYRDNSEDALIMTASNLGEAYLAWLESNAWITPGCTDVLCPPLSASIRDETPGWFEDGKGGQRPPELPSTVKEK
jgi:ribosomal-protein-alanine N-acetyltransferase